MAEFKVGQTVEMSDGRKGVVRFIGEIHVAPGQFIGIELPDDTGKNDGSVKGERYFDCSVDHGLFVRPAGIARVVSQPPAPKPINAPRPAAGPRASLAKAPAPRTSLRPTSFAGPAKPPVKPTTLTNRLSIVPPSQQAVSKAPIRKASASSSTASTVSRPGRTSTIGTKPAPASSTASVAAKTARDTQAKAAAIDALETKIRHLEKQHAEDRDQLKQLDAIRSEKARFEGIIQKLQNKCQTYHQDAADLKTQMKHAEAEIERLSRIEQEAESVLELATLDREMAEERAEQAEAELESLRQQLEEQALELEILNSERELLTSDMSDEEKQAAGYYRLQNENDRLKEALLRLKDITEESENDLKLRVRELEADQSQTDQLRDVKDTLETQLSQHETTIDDLRQQLDAANAWEDIIEDLSDQNQQIKDQLAEKDLVIRDLENLKELNDELEVHHVEQEDELRAELEAREVELAEQIQKITEQDAAMADQESLITKFRDLVLDLQSKMTDAESSKTMSEEQANDVTGRFNEVMELNRQLRTANVASTTKTIRTELMKLEAAEASEELHIIKNYLSTSIELYSSDPLRAYFRTKRIAFKAMLSSSSLKTINDRTHTADETERCSSELYRITSIKHLAQIHFRCKQLSSAISASTLEQFTSFARALEELGPVEKTIESCLEGIMKDEVDFRNMSTALHRSNGILRGVSQDFKTALDGCPEEEIIFHVSSLQSNLEAIGALFTAVSACAEAITFDGDDHLDGSDPTYNTLCKNSKDSMNGVRVAAKLLKTLTTLQQDSLYPSFPEGVEQLVLQDESLQSSTQAVEKLAVDFTDFLLADSGEQLAKSEVLRRMQSMNDELLNLGDLFTKLDSWTQYASVLMNSVEIEIRQAPWLARAQQLEAARSQSAEAEQRLVELTAEHHSVLLQVRERDEILETKDLEIEHLRAKNREAINKTEEFSHLQNQLRVADQQQTDLQAKLNVQLTELQRLKERTETQQPVSPADRQPPSAAQVVISGPQKSEQASTPSTFITVLKALRSENHWLRRRENHEMFGSTLKQMFSQMRNYQATAERRRQTSADEMLAMSLDIDTPETTTSIDTSDFSTPSKSFASLPDFTPSSDFITSTPPFPFYRSGRLRTRSPILLTPLKTPLSWTSTASTPASYLGDLEDLSFIDLSPVAEEFSSEMERALEGFSELGNTTMDAIIKQSVPETDTTLEGFSEIRDLTIENMIEHATRRS